MPEDETKKRKEEFDNAKKQYVKDLLTAYTSLKSAMGFLVEYKSDILFFNFDSNHQERTDLLDLIQYFERFCDNHELHRIIGYKEN